MTTDAALILTTCPNREVAEKITDALLNESLAACIQMGPEVESRYRWKGKIERGNEIPLLIKSQADLFEQVASKIRSLHPFEIPEILSIPIRSGDQDYLRWIFDETRRRST